MVNASSHCRQAAIDVDISSVSVMSKHVSEGLHESCKSGGCAGGWTTTAGEKVETEHVGLT